MTREQLNKYRVIVRKISHALNRDEDDVHRFLKGKFFKTSYLSDENMSLFIDDSILWAAEYGIEA
jgi:hypothetical protein